MYVRAKYLNEEQKSTSKRIQSCRKMSWQINRPFIFFANYFPGITSDSEALQMRLFLSFRNIKQRVIQCMLMSKLFSKKADRRRYEWTQEGSVEFGSHIESRRIGGSERKLGGRFWQRYKKQTHWSVKQDQVCRKPQVSLYPLKLTQGRIMEDSLTEIVASKPGSACCSGKCGLWSVCDG